MFRGGTERRPQRVPQGFKPRYAVVQPESPSPHRRWAVPRARGRACACGGSLLQVGKIQVRSDVADRPAEVGRDQVQDRRGHGSEAPDPRIAAEHDDRYVDAGEQVVQVVVELGELDISVLQLLVHGGELFVDRLELLLRGLELLIRALQFLVARQELLVGRLQLLVVRFALFDDRLQKLLGRRELLAEVLDVPPRVSDRAGNPASRYARLPRRGNTLEEHEVVALPGGPAHRDDLKSHLGHPTILLDAEPLASDRRVLLPRLVDRHAQLRQQAFPSDLQEGVPCLAGGGLEIGARVTAELKDLRRLIDEDAGGGVLSEKDPVDLLHRLRPPPGGLARTPRGPARPGLRGPAIETAQAQVEPPRGRPLGVDLVLFVDHREEVRQWPDGLRHSQHQEAWGRQGIVEDRRHAPLQLQLEVDEHVAAYDEVHLREGRVRGQVVLREDAELAHRLADLILAIQLHEEAPQPRRRDIELDILRIDPGARLRDRDVTDDGSEQLDRDGASLVAKVLDQLDGQRVGFLSRRTARRPDADRRVRWPLLDDGRKDAPLQDPERVRIPEKPGHVHEQVVVQRLHLGGVLLEVAAVALDRTDAVNQHAPGDAASDRRLPIQRGIDAGLFTPHPEDLIEGF